MFANDKLIAAMEKASDAALDWAIAHGGPLLLTLLLTAVGFKAAHFLIDRIGEAVPGTIPGGRVAQRVTTLTGILRSTVKTVILFAGGLVALSETGINVTPILASAGIVGLAVGFGAQSLVKDIISGFFILFEDQYGVGDVVVVGDHAGLVERMNLRITQLRNLDGDLITIPNGSVGVVSNKSKDWARAVVEVGVSYESDVDRVLHVMIEEGVRLQADWPEKIIEAPEVLGLESFADSAIQLRVMVKTAPLQQWAVAREWRRRIKQAFDREGIEIPFPQRVYRFVGPSGPIARSEEELPGMRQS